MRGIFSVLFSLLFLLPIASQEDIAVVLTRTEGVWPIAGAMTKWMEDVTVEKEIIRNIPGAFSSGKLWKLELNEKQKLYERARQQGIPDQEARSQHSIPVCDCDFKHEVYMMAVVREGKKLIVVDTDNNRDFSNDRIYEFDMSERSISREVWNEWGPTCVINYERYDGKGIVRSDILMKLFPFVKKSEENEDVTIEAGLYEHRTGTFQVKGTEYDVAIVEAPFHGYFAGNLILFKEVGTRYIGYPNGIDKPTYRAGDAVYFEGMKYTIDHISFQGDTLYMKYGGEVGEKEHFGFETDQYLRSMEVTTFDGEKLSTVSKEGQYTVYHFWGSCCVWCANGMPDLASMVSRYTSEKVRFVGICADDDRSAAEVFKTKYHMTWPQVYEEMRTTSPDALTQLLRVGSYPSYIIVDPEGKILVRAAPGVGYEKVERFLEEVSR